MDAQPPLPDTLSPLFAFAGAVAPSDRSESALLAESATAAVINGAPGTALALAIVAFAFLALRGARRTDRKR